MEVLFYYLFYFVVQICVIRCRWYVKGGDYIGYRYQEAGFMVVILGVCLFQFLSFGMFWGFFFIRSSCVFSICFVYIMVVVQVVLVFLLVFVEKVQVNIDLNFLEVLIERETFFWKRKYYIVEFSVFYKISCIEWVYVWGEGNVVFWGGIFSYIFVLCCVGCVFESFVLFWRKEFVGCFGEGWRCFLDWVFQFFYYLRIRVEVVLGICRLFFFRYFCVYF